MNWDLIRPWIILEYGPQKVYPRLIMARPEEEDVAAFPSAVTPLIGLGLRVKESAVLAKFGLNVPDEKDRILGNSASEPPQGANDIDGEHSNSIIKRFSAPIKYLEGSSEGKAALYDSEASMDRSGDPAPEVLLADQLEIEAGPAMRGMIDKIEVMITAAGSLDELREILRAGFPDLDSTELAGIMA